MEKNDSEITIDTSCFQTGNEILIISTLKQIQEKGDLNHLSQVIDLITNTPNESVKKHALSMIKEVKSSEIKGALLTQLSKFSAQNINNQITALYWEIAVDLSGNLDKFCEILLTGIFDSAIEAYTVITENAERVTEESALRYKKLLLNGVESADEERKGLVVDCIKLFSEKV